MRIKKIFFFVLNAFILFSPMFAKISFGTLDINSANQVLFTITHSFTGSYSYTSLLSSTIKNGTSEGNPTIITCFPEQMELLDEGNILQIRNRYGIAQYNNSTATLTWLKKTSGIPQNALNAMPCNPSPNGLYNCYIAKTGICSGNIILENVKDGKSVVLSSNALTSYENLPIKWAPDSSILLYQKDDGVYFCSPDAILRGVEIEEKYRKIGRGTINSVYWASSRYLAYVDDYMLYRINTKELYSTSLYSSIIGQGKAMGRLPFQFNSLSDSFSTNNDATAILVIQNNKIFNYLQIHSMSLDYMDIMSSFPYTDRSASLSESYVFWDITGQPVLWQEKLPYSGYKEKGSVYTFKEKSCNQVLEIEDSGKPVISPDRSKVAFWSDSTIYVYDINTWEKIAQLSGEKILNALWQNRNVLYVGGEKSIRKWNLITDKVETITLSSCEKAYWHNGRTIVAGSSGKNYSYNTEKNTWQEISESITYYSQTQNGRYRIYTGSTQNKNFENALYVRTLTGMAVTKPVYAHSIKKAEEQKKVALIFDAYDNADGLPKIISTLKRYNIKGTFFINGEFIRRYPLETNQIVVNGHNCANMFFTATDLTDASFVFNEDFILRGLARNEDEFFDCTGKELELYWHTPYYRANQHLKNYGQLAGYQFVESQYKKYDFDSDTKLVDLITDYYNQIEKNNGGFFPVTVGFSQGLHPDTLYNHLDLIIGTLIDAGFQIVLVNEM